ncbi:hypothetical protein C2S51_000993 [Perilla frutescens var. frutescens]|nr:hypothetical protein C2S51_000993 [Perilla frutescens var. frutescens]
MSDVPSEMYREILLRMPAESVFRLKAVCKEWRRLIEEPSFIKSHSNNQSSNTSLLITNPKGAIYSLSLDSLSDRRQTPIKQLICRGIPPRCSRPLASCNGMFLISDDNDKIWMIWNPLTRERHELPRPEPCIYMMGRGFGYDSAADDYKVVRIDYMSSVEEVVSYRSLVYSMKSGCWKMIDDCPHYFSSRDEGVFLNGALHWRAEETIIVLDLVTEDYRQLALPPLPTRNEVSFLGLNVVGGCLVLSYYHMISRFVGWVMNDHSWKNLFLFFIPQQDIGPHSMVRQAPVAYLKGGNQVLVRRDSGFFLWDAKNSCAKKVIFDGLPANISSWKICQGSFFGEGYSIS